MTRNAPAENVREMQGGRGPSSATSILPQVCQETPNLGMQNAPGQRAIRARPVGAGDEVIMSIAGHVSRAMLSRYSHVRMEAKRRVLDEIAARQEKSQRL